MNFIGLKDLKYVMKALHNFSKWERLGVYLGLDPGLLDQIKKNNRECGDCLFEMLSEWLKQQYDIDESGKPTWSKLADEVGQFDSALASKIRREHCPCGKKD